jgi:hypothetical protein
MLLLMLAKRQGMMEGGQDFGSPKQKKRLVLATPVDGTASLEVRSERASMDAHQSDLLQTESTWKETHDSESQLSFNLLPASLHAEAQHTASQYFPITIDGERGRGAPSGMLSAPNSRQQRHSIGGPWRNERFLDNNVGFLETRRGGGLDSLLSSNMEHMYPSTSLSPDGVRVLRLPPTFGGAMDFQFTNRPDFSHSEAERPLGIDPLSRELALQGARNAAYNAYAASPGPWLLPTTTMSAPAGTQALARRLLIQEAIDAHTNSSLAVASAFPPLSHRAFAGLLHEQQMVNRSTQFLRNFGNLSRHQEALPGMNIPNIESIIMSSKASLPAPPGPSALTASYGLHPPGVSRSVSQRSAEGKIGGPNCTDDDVCHHSFPPPQPSANSKQRLVERLPFPDSSQDLTASRCVPLGIDEDVNWLSELLCFVRSELVEVYRAQDTEVRDRNSTRRVRLGQVGIRCRFCAHEPAGTRASRSSCFPSSLARIYQSLTMMMRDHFGNCQAIPQDVLIKYTDLKRNTSQGATDSKTYWVDSAMKLGLEDSDDGIWVSSTPTHARSSSGRTDVSNKKTASPGGLPASSATRAMCGQPVTAEDSRDTPAAPPMPPAIESPVPIVFPEDRDCISPLFYLILSQLQFVNMDESERTGNRKKLHAGLTGFGCRRCCQAGRRGLCREFPARRRTLSLKLYDLNEHLLRCTLCPPQLKAELKRLKRLEADQKDPKMGKNERIFFEKLWIRMGHREG